MPQPELSRSTRLQIAAGLRTRVGPDGHVLVDSPVGTLIDIGPRGHALLDLFSQPTTLGRAVDLTASGDATSFAPTMHAINMLIEEGALVTAGHTGRQTSGWADPVEHARMLHDERRTGDFMRALDTVVRPGDVVVEIGTGSGILAVGAIRAGARHVYAIEASDIAGVARRVFERNGVQDRVTLIPGWSREIELPEPADVLVSEVIGNEPFEEEILETTLDARERLLKPGARLVPHELTLHARPLALPEGELRQRAFGRAAVQRWRDLYDVDFGPLLEATLPGPVHTLTEGEVVSTWPPLGPPVALLSIDLTRFETLTLRSSADLTLDGPGSVNAVAVTFRAGLAAGITHTLDPWRWPASSWATSVWVLPEPIDVPSDASLRVTYRRRDPSGPDGLTCELRPAAT